MVHHVKAINYSDHTIRLVNVGVHEGNCSSLPLHSLSVDNFTSDYNIGARHYKLSSFLWEHTDAALFVACEKPVISPQYVDVNNASRDCSINRDVLVGSSSSHDHDRQRYSYYIVPGDMRAGDLADRCRVDKVFPTMPRPRPGSRDRDINSKKSWTQKQLIFGGSPQKIGVWVSSLVGQHSVWGLHRTRPLLLRLWLLQGQLQHAALYMWVNIFY